MSRVKLRHRWSGMLAVGALVLSARTDVIRAASAIPTETYQATEVISHMLGSKQTVGYFRTVRSMRAHPDGRRNGRSRPGHAGVGSAAAFRLAPRATGGAGERRRP